MPNDLSDSRWGRSVRIGDYPIRGKLPLTQGVGDSDPHHTQDWTVYIQRTPAVENLYLAPDSNWTISIEYGSGGAQLSDVLPLDVGGEYVLHYASAMPPRIWLTYANTVGTYDANVVTVVVAPGRPARSIVPGMCAVDGSFSDGSGVIQAWWKALDIPFGAVGLYVRSIALMTAPTTGGTWELPATMISPAISPPPYATPGALQSAIAPWWATQMSPPASTALDNLTATDIIRSGQVYVPISGVWSASRKAILLGNPTPSQLGSGMTAVSVRTHYAWEVLR